MPMQLPCETRHTTPHFLVEASNEAIITIAIGRGNEGTKAVRFWVEAGEFEVLDGSNVIYKGQSADDASAVYNGIGP